jgi:integrase
MTWHLDRGMVPGFGIRVYATGRKVWGMVRRWDGPASSPSFHKIGEYPDVGLAEARAKARLLADPGANPRPRPSDAPPAEADAPAPDTFGTLAEAFLAHGRTKRGRPVRAGTLKEYRRALMVYAAGLHDRPVREIRRGDVADLVGTVATGRGTTTAMRCRAALSRFFSWLIAKDKVDFNPVTGTEGYATPARDRVLTDAELAAIWAATGDGTDFGLIVRLLLWTGARRSEVGSMGWSEVQDGTWTVPGTRTKNHRPLVLPLPRQAREALAAHPRGVGRDLVFGRGPVGFQAWSKAKERLDRKLGFVRPWDLHDLRRSVQTRLIAQGISRDLVNRLLNHAMNPIDAAYDHHDYLAEKAGALQLWADRLDRIVATTTKVVVAMPA